jgi:glycosyltransferase involved in cell wall biosynthesis
LRYAKGKWLLFADADDFFTANAFESICNELNSPCDIIYFKVDSCDSDTLKPADRDKTYNMLTTDYYRNRTQESEERLRYYHTVPWGKMLKRNLVVKNDIQFDEVIGSNDVMFLLLAGYYAAQIDVSDFAIYCVTEKKGSLTHIRSKEMLTSRYVVRLRCNQFLRTHGKKQYRDPIVAFHLVRAITQYGLKQFFKFIRLAVIYKENPFIGGKWLIKLIISKCFKNKKYYRT